MNPRERRARHAPSQTLLLVDDDDVFRARLARAFRERGFEVVEAENHAEAIAAARREAPELALVDLRLPGESGLDVVRDLRELEPTTRIVVLTGYGSIATALESLKLGASHYLAKPADIDHIMSAFDGVAGTVTPEGTPSLARVEWEHIQRVLTDCEGNVSEAARVLGIHRRSLQRKLAKYPVIR